MDARTLLAELHGLGVTAIPVDGRIRLLSRTGVLTPDLVNQVREHKPKLLHILTPPPDDPAFRAVLAVKLLSRGTVLDWPELRISGFESIMPGEAAWHALVDFGTTRQLTLALAAVSACSKE